MSARSGRSSETARALRAPAHSWAAASILDWTSFSPFHKPVQKHKQALKRDPTKPKKFILFSEQQPTGLLKPKLLTKKTPKISTLWNVSNDHSCPFLETSSGTSCRCSFWGTQGVPPWLSCNGETSSQGWGYAAACTTPSRTVAATDWHAFLVPC